MLSFSSHGTPVQLLSEDGRNYVSQEFEQFAKDWEFEHVTCSPHHHKSNGRAEAAVKIMKNILKKSIKSNTDVHKALLEWRNAVAPGETASPAQKNVKKNQITFSRIHLLTTKIKSEKDTWMDNPIAEDLEHNEDLPHCCTCSKLYHVSWTVAAG